MLIYSLINILDRPTDEDKEEFFSEIQTMKTVPRHANIVALLGFCTLKEPLQIVMEYVGCGDLVSTAVCWLSCVLKIEYFAEKLSTKTKT